MAKVTATTEEVNFGIGEENRKAIAANMGGFLADTYALYLKTQNYHWNVTGPLFESLHKMFEEQYKELAEVVDKIAERIRALGQKSPASFSDFSRLTTLKESAPDPTDEEMVRALIDDHEAITRSARNIFKQTEQFKDPATADLLTERMESHEKFAWMLKSVLSKG